MVEISGGEILAMATAVVNKWYGGEKRDREELVSAGCLGVCKAVRNFNEGMGWKFSTFAYRCARNEISMYLRGERKWRDMVEWDEVGEDSMVGEDGREHWNGEVESSGLADFIRGMGARERYVIEEIMRGRKQTEIAGEVGCSRQQINRIVNDIRKKVCERFEYRNGGVFER